MKPASRGRTQRPLSVKAKCVGLAIGALLFWQILAISLAASHSNSSTDITAADSADTSQVAAIAAAEQRLSDGDFAGAKVFATHAMSVSTISAASLRDLGLAEQGLGNWQRSGALFSQSAALGWRDTPTQIWLAQAFLQQKDDRLAAQRFDAALRVSPLSSDLFNMLDQQIHDPGLTNAIIERLQLNPNWRTGYLRHMENVSLPVLISRSRILIALASSATPPSRDETIPLLYALIQANHAKLARMIWDRTQHVTVGEVYDPRFQLTGARNMAPFEWSVYPVLGATVAIESQEAGGGLSATTDGTAAGALLRQVIALKPGPHNLIYDGTISAVAHRAFGWRVRCISGGQDLINTVRSTSNLPYHFNVPGNCGAQRMELLVASSSASAGSEVRFKKVDIN